MLYDKVYESPRPIPAITLKDDWQGERRHNAAAVAASSSCTKLIQPIQETISASDGRPVAVNEGDKFSQSWLQDPRIATFVSGKADNSTRTNVKELIHQIENLPDLDALQADLMQNQTYNPFSEKSKNMIHDMANVEYFELCETMSEVQCSYCLSYWTKGIVYCTCRTCLCITEKTRNLYKDRFDTLWIPKCVIKKGPTHGMVVVTETPKST